MTQRQDSTLNWRPVDGDRPGESHEDTVTEAYEAASVDGTRYEIVRDPRAADALNSGWLVGYMRPGSSADEEVWTEAEDLEDAKIHAQAWEALRSETAEAAAAPVGSIRVIRIAHYYTPDDLRLTGCDPFWSMRKYSKLVSRALARRFPETTVDAAQGIDVGTLSDTYTEVRYQRVGCSYDDEHQYESASNEGRGHGEPEGLTMLAEVLETVRTVWEAGKWKVSRADVLNWYHERKREEANIWEDMIRHLDGFDKSRTAELDQAYQSNVVAFDDGTVVRFDEMTGRWAEAEA